MLKDLLGRTLPLKTVKSTPAGFFLEKDGEEFFLPGKLAPEGLKIGDVLEVFLYRDSEDRLSATTEKPLAQLGEIKRLRIRDESAQGWYLDWGLGKDLLLPRSQIKMPPGIGQRVLVLVYYDEKGHNLAATTLFQDHLNRTGEGLHVGFEGDAVCLKGLDAGYLMALESRWIGMVFREELTAPIGLGDKRRVWVKKIREDGKIDLTLRDPDTKAELDKAAETLLKALEKAGGFLPVHDKSPPEEIRSRLGLSKKDFKRAAGILYRERVLKITEKGLEKLS